MDIFTGARGAAKNKAGNTDLPRLPPAGVFNSGLALDLIREGYDGCSALPPARRAYPPKVMDEAERNIEHALAAWPRLTTYGLADAEAMRRKFDRQRADMLAAKNLAAFVATQAWLRVNAATPAMHAVGDDPAYVLLPGDVMSSCWLRGCRFPPRFGPGFPLRTDPA